MRIDFFSSRTGIGQGIEPYECREPQFVRACCRGFRCEFFLTNKFGKIWLSQEKKI